MKTAGQDAFRHPRERSQAENLSASQWTISFRVFAGLPDFPRIMRRGWAVDDIHLHGDSTYVQHVAVA
jgi:hypothetical protein